MYNQLLKKQLQEYIGNKELSEEYAGLFKVISDAYDNYERNKGGITVSANEQLREMRLPQHELKKEFTDVQTLFQNIEIVFFSIDIANLRVNQMTAACEKVYGYKPEEFVSDLDLWKKVIYPDDIHLLDNHENNLAKGKSLEYQYRIIHKDGSIRWIESKIIPTLDAGGELERIDGIAYDITDKKTAEEKIMFTEHLLSEAQQLGNMGNWNINMLTGEMFWSESLKDILGVSRDYEPALGDEINSIHPEDREKVKSEIVRIKQNGGILKISYRIVRKCDGKIRTVHSVVHTTRNKNGHIERIYGTTHDVTNQLTTEEKLEQYNLTMYQISHDLRGPLNSAKNYIYLALKKVEDKTAYKYLIKIHNSYNKMEHRVLSLLDFQRINREELNIEKLNMDGLVKDVINAIDAIQGFNEVEVYTDINVDYTFYSDRQFLHSIIHNLVSNAVTNRRDIPDAFVRISAYTDDADIVIKIEDNGTGIPGEMKDKIFEKFFKGDNSLTGTGLGLYIVKTLVDRLNGTITFDSEELKGTTFTLRIPSVI